MLSSCVVLNVFCSGCYWWLTQMQKESHKFGIKFGDDRPALGSPPPSASDCHGLQEQLTPAANMVNDVAACLLCASLVGHHGVGS
jgi:hypothetical protein